jgi:hypothetical protein
MVIGLGNDLVMVLFTMNLYMPVNLTYSETWLV